MIRTVLCSACSTSFPIDPRKVPAEGVYARCTACEEVFFVEGGTTMGTAPPATSEEYSFAVGSDPSLGGEAPDVGVASDAPPALDEPDDWVFETEPETETDSPSPHVERLDTVEEGFRKAKEEAPWFSEPTDPAPPAPAVSAPEPSAPKEPAAPASGFAFGRRDPHEKASRLARVLVSDIITYNPQRHQQALEGGTVKQDFDDEIQKSWGEYVDQVGRELAESTDYFNQALNEILARGESLF